ELNFIKAKRVDYPQFKNDFIPWLSVLDALMFCDILAVQTMLGAYELV
ncbi:MAG: WbqC-like family protein, partial [Spirosoma sp.]|nr:WbqC-like family protein [Spirosoma sp.]